MGGQVLVNFRVVGILSAGFFTVFAAFGIRYSYGILLPEMLPALGISKTEAGIIFSSYFFLCTLCAPLLGLLVDRWNARILLSIFVATLGMGAYLMSFSTTVLQASFFFALAGIGHSACWAPFVTVVLRWVSDKRRGVAISIIDLGSTGGIAFWSIMIPLIIGPYSWRTVWVWLGVSAFVAAAMNFLFVKSQPPTDSEPQGSVGASNVRIPIKTAYKAIFQDKKFYLIGLSYLLISFSILIPFTFLTTYATQELKIPYQTAAGLVALIGIAGAVGKLPLGHLSDMVGRVKVMMLCGVLTGIGGSAWHTLRDLVSCSSPRLCLASVMGPSGLFMRPLPGIYSPPIIPAVLLASGRSITEWAPYLLRYSPGGRSMQQVLMSGPSLWR